MYTLLLMLALVLMVGVVRGQTNLNDFQGYYSPPYGVGNIWAGGALSCPSGSLGMNITLGPASYEQNFTFCTTGGQPAPQFGGVFGFDLNTSTCLNPNPFTGDCSCSTAASYSPVVTTVNMVNYTFCIGVIGYGFAGLYFVEYIDGVATCTSPNPLNGSCGCPDGYSAVGDFGMVGGTFGLCSIDCSKAMSAATCNSAPYCSICQSTESPFPFACSYSSRNEACCVSGNGQVVTTCSESNTVCLVNETGASCVCPESQMCDSDYPMCCPAGQDCCANEYNNEFMCCDGQCCPGGTFSASCCSADTTCCSWSDPDNPNHQFTGCCTSTEVCSPQNAGCVPA